MNEQLPDGRTVPGVLPYDFAFPYPSVRLPVFARNVVATTQPLAAQAGLAMLARGGNAVDAAVATAITLTVVEPTMNGIGGDLFAMVWDGKTLGGLNASGRSPMGWSPERFAGRTAMPQTGIETVTVPGCVSGWVALHQRHGRLPFKALFEAAIRYATEGYLVPWWIGQLWAIQAKKFESEPTFRDAFMPGGRAPQAGEVFRSPTHARTLQEIAETNGESFYRGALARKIAAFAASRGGALNEADLAAHEPEWVEPLSLTYGGHEIRELPPNGQGIAALIALGILENTEQGRLAPDDPLAVHLEIEAMRLAFAEVDAHVADPRHMTIDPQILLEPGRLAAHAKSIDRARAGLAGATVPSGGTVYIAAADASGMMVSLIQSNYHGFGSGLVVPETGIALQNRGSGFTLKPDHCNEVGPGKRPFHTIIPGFITKASAPVAAFGIMGGNVQAQAHTQVIRRILTNRQNPQAALDAPRWRLERSGVLLVEPSMDEALRSSLAAMGHNVTPMEPWSQDTGAGQIVWALDDGYLAASESRRDGAAVGF